MTDSPHLFPPDQATLAQAIQLHQAGRLVEAEQLYRQILSASPGHADSLYLLGVIARQRGRLGDAVDLISRAIRLRSTEPSYHSNLGNALKGLGKFDEAMASYDRAISLNAEFAEAHYNRGALLQERGQRDAALASYARALAIRPDFAEAHHNRGSILKDLGRPDEAVACYDRALAVRPAYPEAHYNRGIALQDQGKLDEAVVSYERAVAISPGFADASNNLGVVLRQLGRVDEAVASFDRAIAARPDFVQALNNRGAALKDQGKFPEAIADYDRALAIRPDFVEALNNRGTALRQLNRLAEAQVCYQRALAIRPDSADVLSNLGGALTEQGRLDEAIACYQSALALGPEFPHAFSNLLLTLHYSERQFEEEHARTVRRYTDLMAGIGTRTPVLSDAEGSASARNHDADLVRNRAEVDSVRAHAPMILANARDPDRRLRVGYVSGDLRSHPVGFFLSCALPAHDRSQVEIFCYSNSPVSDAITAGLRARADHWRMVVGRPDAEVDALIRQDAIDILVDLSGHTARNRLAVFAGRAAPVQATWLGYFGTTGLPTMDYIVADRFVVPPGEEGLFTESVWRLPDSYICFAPPAFDVPIQPRPAGELVLGCFNNWSKVSDGTVRLWSQILREIPDSRLFLKTRFLDNPEVRQLALRRFAEQGVAAERLILEGPCARAELLAAYNRMDIALDPFPYGGGVTTAEALWMGVPVVCMHGDRWVARVAESVVTAAGLPDLVATEADGYVRLVKELAGDRSSREMLRRTLRATMATSPLCDGSRFATSLEAAYRGMWRRWCSAHLEVSRATRV